MVQRRKPNFFFVGAPKCGTTALYEYLKEHPDIYMCEIKETAYFSPDIEVCNYKNEREYLKLFKDNKGEKILGEASTCHLYSKVAANKIKKFNPKAKILISLRNPVEFMHSKYYHNLRGGRENLLSFEEALNAIKDRKKGKRIPYSAKNQRYRLFYKDHARYSEQVKRYLDLFGKKNTYILIFENFIKNSAKEYKNILRFLNVDDSFIVKTFKKKNVTRKIKSRTFQRIYQSKILLQLAKVLPKRIRKFGNDFVKKINSEEIERPKVDKLTRKKLLREFKPEINKLSRLIDKDLSIWYKTED